MMWRAVQEEIERRDGRVQLNSDVVQINRTEKQIDSIVISENGRADDDSGNTLYFKHAYH